MAERGRHFATRPGLRAVGVNRDDEVTFYNALLLRIGAFEHVYDICLAVVFGEKDAYAGVTLILLV